MTIDTKHVENRRKLRSWLIVLGVIAFVALIAVLGRGENAHLAEQ